MATKQIESHTRRSWRQSPARAAATRPGGSKAPLRALLAALVTALLAAFAWLLWQPAKPEPPTHFVALLTGPSDLLSLPPILFEQQTVAPLEQFQQQNKLLRFVDASQSQRAGQVEAIKAALDELGVEGVDRVVIYVSAHGVSDDGQAYVLAPDFDLRQPQARRYGAADLIRAVSSLNAAMKLLVFDCSRMAVHPRLGMAANEFALLVADETRQIEDPSLHVMIATPDFGSSPMGLLERRSMLGGALVDALLGDADLAAHGGNEDHNVTLDELSRFVVQRCRSAPVAAPVPQLISGAPDAAAKAMANPVVLRLPTVSGTQQLAALAAKAKQRTAKPQETQQVNSSPRQEESKQRAASSGRGPSPAPAVAATTAGSETADQSTAIADGSEGGADKTAVADESAEAAADATAEVEAQAPSEAGGDAQGPQISSRQQQSEPGGRAAADEAAGAPPPELVPAIAAAWRLRDRLQGVDADPGDAIPVDCAPHLWNELNATLASLHLAELGHSQGEPSSAKTTELIGQFRRGLQQLIDGRDAAPSGGLATDRLAAARRAYMTSGALGRLQSLDEPYVEALLDQRRYLVRAQQFVEWHAVIQGTPGGAALAAETTRLVEPLLQELAALDRTLSQVENTNDGASAEARTLFRQLAAIRDKIRNVAAQLDRRVEAEVAAISRSGDPVLQRSLENLLGTSLASAAQRETLLAAKRRPAGGPIGNRPSSLDWTGVFDHLRLEALLVQLVDPAMKASEPLNAVMAARFSAAGDEQQRRLLRAAGRALRDFYAELAARTRQFRQAGASPQQMRAADRMVAVMHPRDVSSSLDERWSRLGFVTPLVQPQAELVVSAPRPVDLRVNQWTKLEWSVSLRNASAARVEAVIADFAVDALQVRFEGDATDARPGLARSFPAGAAATISLLVRAKSARAGSAEGRTESVRLKVTASTSDGALEDERTARVIVPRPNRIELIAFTVDPRRAHRETSAECVELQPYPNRSTTFEFHLANGSGEAKNLQVDLIALPAPVGQFERLVEGGWPPGRLLDESGHVAPELTAWAERALSAAPVIASGSVALPADDAPRRVTLKAPGAAAPADPEGEAADDGAAAPQPPEPKPPASVDVTQGVACRIVNQDRPEETWLKWIEIVPLRPTSYIDFESAVVNREIRITARPSDADGDGQPELPPGILEKPALLVIRGDGAVFSAGSAVPDAFNAIKLRAQLAVQPLESVRGRPTIAVDADGVPRAAAWRIDFENQRAEQIRNPAAVRIERLAMTGIGPTPPRLYRMTPYVDYPLIDDKQWPTVIDVGNERICAFDVSRGVRPLELRLRADAPLDAFNTVGGGNAVVLSWQDDVQAPHRLYDDRDIRSQIVSVTEDGAIEIATTVDDFGVTLRPPGVNDKAIRLTARLSVQGAPEQIDSVLVIFDGRPPRIDHVSIPRKIEIGTSYLNVDLAAADLSGIAKVEAWITGKRLFANQDLLPDAAEPLALPDFGTLRPNAEQVRRMTLRAAAPREAGVYYLTLKVTDLSGQSVATLDRELKFEMVEPPPPPEPGPVVADLKGVVMLGARPAPAGLAVTVKEKPAFKGTTDKDGRFTIKSLEAGAYTLVVSGTVTSRPAAGEQEITLSVPADYEWKVVVPASIEWADPPKE